MTEALSRFREHMDRVMSIASSQPVPNKVLRYVRAYEAGLPQDITVRWFPKEATHDIEERVAELVSQGREVWMSQGLPSGSNSDTQLSSVESKTELIKGLVSLQDFRTRVIPNLALWKAGTWAKVFFDTPQRALVGGTIRMDTNRPNVSRGVDMRSIRFEAASGISDVRDLDRQISAREVLVVYSKRSVFNEISEVLGSNYKVTGICIDDLSSESALSQLIIESARGSERRVQEPKVIILDFSTSQEESIQILRDLKSNKNTSFIPIIPIMADSISKLPELQSRVASFVYLPISANSDKIQQSVNRTGLRLTGNPQGFQFWANGVGFQEEVARLINTVFGPSGAYRRMMTAIANAEQRPTIAFEFKLVPSAPYDFFFLDYEWSGPKSSLHRFDWLLNLADG